ncbi:MAG: DUF4040 domain-containing protein [Alphaproteobacteria bacterium]
MNNFLNWPTILPEYLNSILQNSLLVLVLICVAAIIFSKDLLISTILLSVFSLLMALIYLMLDAPDVAITEAAVGACISTIILLIALTYTKKTEYYAKFSLKGFIVVFSIGIALIYALYDIPEYGNINNPIHTHVTPHYIQKSGHEIGINAIAASILASYRGYDTLGETSVILTAALAVIIMLTNNKEKKK